jgi:hypothetical protein
VVGQDTLSPSSTTFPEKLMFTFWTRKERCEAWFKAYKALVENQILFVSNSQCWWMFQSFWIIFKRMNIIHILVVVRLGFRSGVYLGFGSG